VRGWIILLVLTNPSYSFVNNQLAVLKMKYLIIGKCTQLLCVWVCVWL